LVPFLKEEDSIVRQSLFASFSRRKKIGAPEKNIFFVLSILILESPQMT